MAKRLTVKDARRIFKNDPDVDFNFKGWVESPPGLLKGLYQYWCIMLFAGRKR
jgi:hypothetical protein